jgi:N-acetylmuramoyl-L-alanine amidase
VVRNLTAKYVLNGTIWVLALAGLTAFAQPPTALKSRRLSGRSYVAVNEVVRYYSLGRTQLALEAEQREIQLDGVKHWLSAPVQYISGQLWIASTDVVKIVDPLVRRGRSPSRSTIRTIILDPGHGGADRGTRGRMGRFEKVFTLDLARRVGVALRNSAVRVVFTRTSDRTLSLDDRVKLAKGYRADLFVSLHFNSGGSASGIETYCLAPSGTTSTASSWTRGDDDDSEPGNRYDGQNVWLAHCVQQALLRATGAEDRGVRRARFVVLRSAPCPAILVEAGFLSNRTEEQKIATTQYRDLMAKAIANGIVAYKSSVERP